VQEQYAQWKETVNKTEYVKAVKENFDKRLKEITEEHDEAVALNDIMRSQRNHFDKLVKVLCMTQTMPTLLAERIITTPLAVLWVCY